MHKSYHTMEIFAGHLCLSLGAKEEHPVSPVPVKPRSFTTHLRADFDLLDPLFFKNRLVA